MEINVFPQFPRIQHRSLDHSVPVVRRFHSINETKTCSIKEIHQIQIEMTGGQLTVFSTDSQEVFFHLSGSVFSVVDDPLPALYTHIQSGTLSAGLDLYQNQVDQPRELHLSIGLPESFLGDLKLKTIHQPFHLKSLSLKSLEFESVSGDLRIERLQATSASIKTATGNITLLEASGNFNLDTVTGEIQLNALAHEKIKIHNITGNTHLKLARPPERISHRTVTGRLVDRLNPLSGGQGSLNLSSITGGFTIEPFIPQG